jgi:hypothetical protein
VILVLPVNLGFLNILLLKAFNDGDGGECEKLAYTAYALFQQRDLYFSFLEIVLRKLY